MERCTRLLRTGEATFGEGKVGSVVSVVQDATRMSGLEMLYTAVFSPRLQLAMWLPPMVPPYFSRLL